MAVCDHPYSVYRSEHHALDLKLGSMKIEDQSHRLLHDPQVVEHLRQFNAVDFIDNSDDAEGTRLENNAREQGARRRGSGGMGVGTAVMRYISLNDGKGDRQVVHP